MNEVMYKPSVLIDLLNEYENSGLLDNIDDLSKNAFETTRSLSIFIHSLSIAYEELFRPVETELMRFLKTIQPHDRYRIKRFRVNESVYVRLPNIDKFLYLRKLLRGEEEHMRKFHKLTPPYLTKINEFYATLYNQAQNTIRLSSEYANLIDELLRKYNKLKKHTEEIDKYSSIPKSLYDSLKIPKIYWSNIKSQTDFENDLLNKNKLLYWYYIEAKKLYDSYL